MRKVAKIFFVAPNNRDTKTLFIQFETKVGVNKLLL